MTTLFLRDRRSLTLLCVVFTLGLRIELDLSVDVVYDDLKLRDQAHRDRLQQPSSGYLQSEPPVEGDPG